MKSWKNIHQALLLFNLFFDIVEVIFIIFNDTQLYISSLFVFLQNLAQRDKSHIFSKNRNFTETKQVSKDSLIKYLDINLSYYWWKCQWLFLCTQKIMSTITQKPRSSLMVQTHRLIWKQTKRFPIVSFLRFSLKLAEYVSSWLWQKIVKHL